MEYKRRKLKKRGFTLIELLVVVAIISLLSSAVLASVTTIREKARDSRRKQDMRQMTRALLLWEDDKGGPMRGDSGCGFKQPSGSVSWAGNDIGDGNGWVNMSESYSSSYDTSISQCLVDEGYIDALIKDRISTTDTTDTSGYAYMKCTRDGTTWLYTRLENKEGNCDEINTGCDNFCTDYSMNYVMSF